VNRALDHAAIATLIPHAGAMCLLDAVLDWDATRIRARSTSHAHADHPLRRDGALHAVHLCEYGAQAAAVHGALVARAAGGAPRAGLLAALREVRLHVEVVDPAGMALDIEAECLLGDAHGAQYAFRIARDGCLLASGRATIVYGAADGC
jgi:predicted hotdog family 3-hydroxylacyl-ACP dehydratase